MISYWTQRYSVKTRKSQFSPTNQFTENKRLFILRCTFTIYSIKNHSPNAKITNGLLSRYLIVMTNTSLLYRERVKKKRKLKIFLLFCFNWKLMINLKVGFIRLNFKGIPKMKSKYSLKNLTTDPLEWLQIGMLRQCLPMILYRAKWLLRPTLDL